MAGRYKEYFEYQPSNDVHIKQLPIGWIMKPLGLVAAKGRTSFVDGPFGSDLKSDEYQDEGIPLIQLNNIVIGKHILQNMKYITEEKMHQLSRHIAKPNDIVIAKMAEPVARAAVVNGQYNKYVIVADCVKLTIDSSIANLSYVVFAINSKEVNSSAELVSTGTTRIRINLTELKNLKIPFPPLAIQQKIANFLEHETAKIDTLIAKQEKLIKLLQEKRQAVISHAVTKGLKPDVLMKNSGIEWLGEVPKHWAVIPNKRLFELTPKKSQIEQKKNELCSFIPMDKLKLDSLVLDEEREISSVFDGYTYFENEDILIAKVTPCFENKNMVVARNLRNGIGFGSSEIYVLRCNDKVNNDFMYYRLQEDGFMSIATAAMTGAGGLKRVPSDVISNFSIALPPLDEQINIVKALKYKLLSFDELSLKAISAIDLMKERKTALISAAVTGKIDVRDWQPKGIQ
ncbi:MULTISPECIES: restriction endonuclease subunit S [Providencia]|uniref:restriction endonuclease subunit S n=1 Tax=Providencia TaxID=586 RepID=UPI002362C385|nr:restriction endonuclease subunit S [Providencia rettgeri]